MIMLPSPVIQVLRRPAHENAYYHEACYTWDKKEVVLRVLQLMPSQVISCAKCGQSVREGAGQKEQVHQLTLF